MKIVYFPIALLIVAFLSQECLADSGILGNDSSCREAWIKLCGEIDTLDENSAFIYVHPKQGLKNVLLYGDSISIAYTPTVRRALKDHANVMRIHKNGGASGEFIETIRQLRDSIFYPQLEGGWRFKWDLIHINVGLHDMKYVDGDNLSTKSGKVVSTIDEYKSNLFNIFKFLKSEFPNAIIVFATTTPVPVNARGRIPGDELNYNSAALEVVDEFDSIMVNDLHAFSAPHLDEWSRKPNDVHYNSLGYTAQGLKVASLIANLLAERDDGDK